MKRKIATFASEIKKKLICTVMNNYIPTDWVTQKEWVNSQNKMQPTKIESGRNRSLNKLIANINLG